MIASTLLKALCLVVTLTPFAWSQPRVGERPPPLGIEHWLNAPEGLGKSWDDFEDQVVVIEFWATWCGPCMRSMPRMNDLVARFEDRPVRFLAISGEKLSVVAGHHEQSPRRAWVGVDTDNDFMRALAIRSFPQVLLVDRRGRIAATLHPEKLEAVHIERMIRSEPPGIDPPLVDVRPVVASPSRVSASSASTPEDPLSGQKPLLELSIAPASGNKAGRLTVTFGRVEIDRASLREILAQLHGISAERVVADDPGIDLEAQYSVHCTTPSGVSARSLAASALSQTLGLVVGFDHRPMRVLLLEAPNDLGPGLERAEDGARTSTRFERSHWELNGVGIGTLATRLAYIERTPVLDRTGLHGRFDIKFDPPTGDRDDLARAVHRQLGLMLREEIATIDVISVRRGG